MAAPNLTRRDVFYGVLIVGITLAALVRSRAERARTDAAKQQVQQVLEERKEDERRHADSLQNADTQRREHFQEAVDLRRENAELRKRLGLGPADQP